MNTIYLHNILNYIVVYKNIINTLHIEPICSSNLQLVAPMNKFKKYWSFAIIAVSRGLGKFIPVLWCIYPHLDLDKHLGKYILNP